MDTQTKITLVVSFLTDFIISAGGAMTAAMVATGSASMPTTAVLILAIVTGLVAGARRVQALLLPSPVEPPKNTPKNTKPKEPMFLAKRDSA